MYIQTKIGEGLNVKAGTPGKRAFWDVEHREPDRPTRPLLGEEKAMVMVLIKSIQDMKGISQHATEECVECHSKDHPDCFKTVERNGEEYHYRINKACRDWHSFQQCAERWLSSDSTDIGTGTGWTFWNLCDHLGISQSYLRKSLASQACNAHWQDDAKIHSFLGFHVGVDPSPRGEEASIHAGRASETGESD